MYCSIPSVISEIRVAAAPNSSSGSAVTEPDTITSAVYHHPCDDGPVSSERERHEHAERDRRDHCGLDRHTLDRGSTGLLLRQPVGPERRGQDQRDPRRPAVVDRQCEHRDPGDAEGGPLPPPSRSDSTMTPSITVNSGVTKYPSEVSTTWPLVTPQMNVPQLNVISTAAKTSHQRRTGSAQTAFNWGTCAVRRPGRRS